jgi:hypothetical protein
MVLTGTAMGEISRTGLVAEWHFDGDAKDSSGNGIDGTIHGTIFVDGKFGKALLFNGVNNYVDFGTGNGNLNFGTGPFSIEFWMNYRGTTVHPNVTNIMGKTLGGADSAGFMAWTTTWGGDGSNYGLFIATTTASWGDGNVEDWGKYYPNIWYHVVFVRSGNTWTIYKNGDYSNSGTKTGIGLGVDNGASFTIGESGNPGPYFNGLIEEVRIYNRALSADEVKNNYEAGRIIITSSLPGAEVLLNGVSKGVASPTLSVYGVSPGTYTVKCKLPGYSDYDTNIVLKATSVVSVSCSPSLITVPPTTVPPTTVPPTTVPPTSPQPAPTSVISVSPDPPSFNFGIMNAGESASQTFLISNAGGGTLTWSISADQPWITINPTKGTNSVTATININTAGLSPGSYSGTITVTSNGGAKTGSISLTMRATPTPTLTPPPTPIPPVSQKIEEITPIPPTSQIITPIPPISQITAPTSPQPPSPFDKDVIIASIGALATIIAAYFGYRAIKKK